MTAPLTETSPLGSLLAGRYEIRAPLGRGGMGEVFEAVDRRLGRTVAVKLLLPDLAADERFLTRFRWEAATAAGLSHLGMVSVHDIGEDAGRTFIVMEFVAGRTLADIARTGAPLDTHRIARVGSASARALAHAHERGIVHRDVSPANIMVTPDGIVKVLDFGIARAGDSALSAAASRGTLSYLAPEVLRGGRVDARADIFALGAVLRELSGEPRDRRLHEVLDRATAPDPAARFASAAAFAQALELIASDDPAATSTAMRALTRERPHRTAPIVRIATRPLSSTAPVRPAVAPARGLAVPRTHRATRGRIARSLAAMAFVAVALGGALVLGQTFVSMSAPQRVSTVTGPAPLPAPTGLTATASCDGLFSTGVDLAWTGTGPLKGYEVWRGGGTDERTLIERIRGVHTQAFRDIDLGVDASYTYRVRAYDGPRVSEWSNVVRVSTPLFCLT
ncbi:MAG: protein kinase [Actinomycetota bacterium]|nr:protein kinase [Actinomycetota bacterium]